MKVVKSEMQRSNVLARQGSNNEVVETLAEEHSSQSIRLGNVSDVESSDVSDNIGV